MAGFGNRPWGSSPFGTSSSWLAGEPEVTPVVDRVDFGTVAGSGAAGTSVLSLREFEDGINFADPNKIINSLNISAYTSTFYDPTGGLPIAANNVLKMKSWSSAPFYQAHDPGYAPDTLDLPSIVRARIRTSKDLPADIFAYGAQQAGDPADLPTSLYPLHLDDFQAILAAIEAVDILASVVTVPGVNLPAQAAPIPSVNLSALSGAHPPVDIPGQAFPVRPVDLPVYLRGGFSDILNLSASITQIGGIKDLGVVLKIASSSYKDLSARVDITGRSTKNLSGFLQPYNEDDLLASITTQRISSVRAIIAGVAPGSHDLSATIARITSASFNIQAFVSAQFVALRDLAAVLRTVELGGVDVPSSLTAVEPYYNVNKITLQMTPLLNLDADVVQVGGLLGVRAIIIPVHHSETVTPLEAGYITTATSYRLHLGTSRGLFVPAQITPEVRISTYSNLSDTPDLHAAITGWNQIDLAASISSYPSTDLPAQVVGLGFDHLVDLAATVSAFATSDLLASISSAGSMITLPATITVAGGISALTATIVPFVDPLGVSVLSVSTQPTYDLAAMINYDSYVRCSPSSAISELSAYVKPYVTGTAANQLDMSAEIVSRLDTLDIPTSITGRKITKVRVLNLTFTAKERGTSAIPTIVTPLHKVYSDLGAQITGLLHEVDFPATITPIRFFPYRADFTSAEPTIDLNSGEIKDVLLSFKSQVQHYVYEEITDTVFPTDQGTWVVDLRTTIFEDSLFDRSLTNRSIEVSDLAEYYSLDEAIRAALVTLCERHQSTLGASITATGAISDLTAQVQAYSLENTANLSSKIMPVVNLPDIKASINTDAQSSAYGPIRAYILPVQEKIIIDLGVEIVGTIDSDLNASITAS